MEQEQKQESQPNSIPTTANDRCPVFIISQYKTNFLSLEIKVSKKEEPEKELDPKVPPPDTINKR